MRPIPPWLSQEAKGLTVVLYTSCIPHVYSVTFCLFSMNSVLTYKKKILILKNFEVFFFYIFS